MIVVRINGGLGNQMFQYAFLEYIKKIMMKYMLILMHINIILIIMEMNNVILYIDPGTGAMFFSVIMGVIGTAYFVLQKAFIKLKFILTAGKVKENTKNAYRLLLDLMCISGKDQKMYKPFKNKL